MQKTYQGVTGFIRFWFIHCPVLDYFGTLLKYRPSLRYLPRVLVYFIKFTFFEPFRVLEGIFFERKIRSYRLKEDPVFILGYYRSGTTHLQETLLMDPQFGYMNFFQTYFCAGFLITERLFKKTFGWIMRLQNYHHPAHRVLFDFDMPGEEDVCLVASGFRYAPNWGQVYQTAFREFFNKFVFFKTCTPSERAEFSFEFKRLVARVALAPQNRNKRLLLKSPPHTARLSYLRELFPRAKFIFIYRNPCQIYKSNLRLWKSFDDQRLNVDDQEAASDKILWSLNECYEAYERDKLQVPAGILTEVRYEDYLLNPLNELKRIYQELQLPGWEENQSRFQSYLALKHGANLDQHHYSSEELGNLSQKLGKWMKQRNYIYPNAG